MKKILYCLLLLPLLLGSCVTASPKPDGEPAPIEGEGVVLRDAGLVLPPDPLEASVERYLFCTAEAAVDAVLDGASLVQSQLLLAERCAGQKIELLSLVEGEDRTMLAQRTKDWDLETIQAVRGRLFNLEEGLKSFMDCSYSSVRDLLTRDHGDVDNQFLEGLVDGEIASCYNESLGDMLHPDEAGNSPVGLARRDKIMLLAKERVMQELYREIQDEQKSSPDLFPGPGKGEVVALAGNS